MKAIILTTVGLFLVCLSSYGQTPISTAADLAAINANAASLKGDYILMNDITVEDWMPIGPGIPFLGTFDGNGHTITILSFYVDTVPSQDGSDAISIGLFGSTGKGSLIKNLRVAGDLTYDSGATTLYMGAIVGDNKGTIRCCISTANVSARGGHYTAGRGVKQMIMPALMGRSNAISVYQNEAAGGGIAGMNKNRIENCYATGQIIATGEGYKTVGGIAGRNGFGDEGKGIIEQCYATGEVVAKEDAAARLAGGIAGMCMPGDVINSVALNEKLETIGTRKGMTVGGLGLGYPSNLAFGVTAYNYEGRGKMKNAYYRNDMAVYMEKDNADEKENKGNKKKALYPDRGKEIDYALTQNQNWWSNDKSGVSFPFGTDEDAPWIWDDDLKRPVLYWENSVIVQMPQVSEESNDMADVTVLSGQIMENPTVGSTLRTTTPVPTTTYSTDIAEMQEQESGLDDNCALLHIYRGNSGVGKAVSYDLYLGSDKVFRAKNNEKTTIKIVNEGTFLLSAKTESTTKKPIDIQFGHEYYVRCGMKMGIVVGRPTIEIVNNRKGEVEFESIVLKE